MPFCLKIEDRFRRLGKTRNLSGKKEIAGKGVERYQRSNGEVSVGVVDFHHSQEPWRCNLFLSKSSAAWISSERNR